MNRNGNLLMNSASEVKSALMTDTGLDVERKNLSVETKILDVDEGVVQMVVSATNIKDYVDDIIEPGAYAETLTTRNPKGVYQHDMTRPVAKTMHAEELMPGDPRLPAKLLSVNAGGLMITAQFNLNTQRGKEAFEDIKFYGDEQEYSIGFIVPAGASRMDSKTGTRYINKIDLFEWSPVTFGAAPGTGTTYVKNYHDSEDQPLIGSYEELSYRLREALMPMFTSNNDTMTEVEILGTFPDKVTIEVTKELECIYYEIPYSVLDNGSIKFGTMVEVMLGSVVIAKSLEEVENKADPSSIKLGTWVQWEIPNGSAYGRVVQIKKDGLLIADPYGNSVGVDGTKENPACLIQVYTTVDGEWKAQEMNTAQSADALLVLPELPSRSITTGQEKAAMGSEQKDTATKEPEVLVAEVATEPIAEPVAEVATETITEVAAEEPAVAVIAEAPVLEEEPAEQVVSAEEILQMLAEMVELEKFANER